MPFVIILLAIWLAVVAFFGDKNIKQLATLLRGDFTGPGNFFYWALAIVGVGSIGFIPGLRKFSEAFLFLILLSMFISNRGFFLKFTQAISATKNPPPIQQDNSSSGGNSGGSGGGLTDLGSMFGGGSGGSGNTFDTGTIMQGAVLAAEFL